jgi:ABC-2 type transport system permease protein
MSELEPVRKATGWRLFLKTILARAYPRVIGQQRDTSWMLFDVLMPFGSMVAYVLVYQAIGAPEEYVGFVVMGGAMTAFWMNILWSMSSQLYWEKETGNLGLYIAAPGSMMAILLGMALGGLVATTLRALVITVAGSLMFHVQYQIASYWQLFTVFVLAMIALYGMGMMMASVFLLLGREAWHMVNLAQASVGFPLRVQDRISYRETRDWHPAGALRGLPGCCEVSAGLHGKTRHS